MYLLYKLNVSCNAIFELSSTSRENKVIARLRNPFLVLLILHQFWMRNVVVPNLEFLRSRFASISRHLVKPIAVEGISLNQRINNILQYKISLAALRIELLLDTRLGMLSRVGSKKQRMFLVCSVSLTMS
jgi:hypothetical protein